MCEPLNHTPNPEQEDAVLQNAEKNYPEAEQSAASVTEQTPSPTEPTEEEKAESAQPTPGAGPYQNPFAPPYSAGQTPPTPPYGYTYPIYPPQYAPQTPPYAAAPQTNYPYWGAPMLNQPAQPLNNPYSYPPQTAPKKKKNGATIALWVLAILLELVLVVFAVIGVYALAGGQVNPSQGNRPGYGNHLPTPSKPDTSSNPSGGTSSNYTNVQMGIMCIQMTDEFWEFYDMQPGLVVDSIDETSNALNTDLQVGDVIIAANGTSVQYFEDLFAVMESLQPGDLITLTAYRVQTTQEGFQQGESFEVTFAVTQKQETAPSSEPNSVYPQA